MGVKGVSFREAKVRAERAPWTPPERRRHSRAGHRRSRGGSGAPASETARPGGGPKGRTRSPRAFTQDQAHSHCHRPSTLHLRLPGEGPDQAPFQIECLDPANGRLPVLKRVAQPADSGPPPSALARRRECAASSQPRGHQAGSPRSISFHFAALSWPRNRFLHVPSVIVCRPGSHARSAADAAAVSVEWGRHRRRALVAARACSSRLGPRDQRGSRLSLR